MLKVIKFITRSPSQRPFFTFASNFIVNNPTTGTTCVDFGPQHTNEQVDAQYQIMDLGKLKWDALSVTQRKAKLKDFVIEYEKDREELVQLTQSATGKHRQIAEREIEASLATLKQDLSDQYPSAIQKKNGVYNFKAFGSILVVCDYRMVSLSCVKYLISCGIAGNKLIFNPHRYGLPVARKIQSIWDRTHPQYPIIYCPVNNYADGLEHLVQKKDMGFVSFSGDIEAGNSFYHFMAQKSEIFAESEFLLMSSDSAYVMKDIPQEKLRKVAENLALACFVSGGNLFNSVKRIFVDQDMVQKFSQLFIQASKVYAISAQDSKASPVITSGHINTAKQLLKQLQQYQGPQLKLLTQFQSKEQYKSLSISPLVYRVDGIASLEYWNKIYSLPVAFIQAVSSPQSAIEHINESIYGISASIYTGDPKNIEKIGQKLDVGVVYGNRWGFSPGVPYSPRKRSGKGCSFSSLSFTNVVKSQSLKGFTWG